MVIPSKVIHGISTLEEAQNNEISYATSGKYSEAFKKDECWCSHN